MEEATTRKLHPVLEALIVATIVVTLSLLRSMAFSPITNLVISGGMTVKTFSTLNLLSNLILSPLCLFLAGFVCFKLIEKRSIHWGILLLIAAAYQILTYIPSMAITSYLAAFGDKVLADFAKVRVVVSPVLAATVMTLIVRLLTAPKVEVSPADPSAKCGLVAHVLLLLFVGGIWRWIWIYRTTRYLNCLPDEEYRNPGAKLLLCVFVPFYSIYWTYKSAKRIDKLAASAGMTSDLAVVCLILEIFVPIVPPILMQDKVNKILDARQ